MITLAAINDIPNLYRKYNTIIDKNVPINPIRIPSIIKGHLINQSVAPTNFIIPTSFLLAYTVSLVVFIIRNIDTPINIMNKTVPIILVNFIILCIVSILSCSSLTLSTPSKSLTAYLIAGA